MSHKDYLALHRLSKETSLLSSVQQLLDWDQETYMPKDAIELRSEQLELMASLIHKSRNSKKFVTALQKLIDLDSGKVKAEHLSAAEQGALRAWRRDYLQSHQLPNPFVKKFAKTVSTAAHVWQQAKAENDFSLFAPHLEKVVALCRKKADYLGFKEHPYDALLDLYEPEMTTAYLLPLFDHLKRSLKQLLHKISAKPQFDESFLYQKCPKEKQIEFSHKILKKMGFSDGTSRLDLSAHPFCCGFQPKDTRMTSRIHEENVMGNIGAVLHEGGHGLYNMGLPVEQYGSPLCEQVSLGIDESQSRWWETLIGQSESFWRYFYPLLQQEFPEQFRSVPLEKFYPAINVVKPGLIRIEADEVTYNLHIALRFEIEKGLIEGSLKVKQVPKIWNEMMRDLLGIVPKSDSQGCLQDIHWSLGSFGYFPTYTLGNLNAAQFFHVFEKSHPQWKEKVSHGELDFIREWLHQEIHRYGRQYTPTELCQKISGKSLSAEPYLHYLEKKYTALYSL